MAVRGRPLGNDVQEFSIGLGGGLRGDQIPRPGRQGNRQFAVAAALAPVTIGAMPLIGCPSLVKVVGGESSGRRQPPKAEHEGNYGQASPRYRGLESIRLS